MELELEALSRNAESNWRVASRPGKAKRTWRLSAPVIGAVVNRLDSCKALLEVSEPLV